MEAYPQAYVIPLGQGQRSNPETPNRLVGWLLRNGIEVAQLKKSYTAGSQTFAAGSYVVFMNQALRGLAHGAQHRRRRLPEDQHPLCAAGAWSHGFLWGADVVPIPDGVTFNPHPVTKPVAGPAALGGGVEAGAATSYALKIDSATAVRALNTLTRDGVEAQFALGSFATATGGTCRPAASSSRPTRPRCRRCKRLARRTGCSSAV